MLNKQNLGGNFVNITTVGDLHIDRELLNTLLQAFAIFKDRYEAGPTAYYTMAGEALENLFAEILCKIDPRIVHSGYGEFPDFVAGHIGLELKKSKDSWAFKSGSVYEHGRKKDIEEIFVIVLNCSPTSIAFGIRPYYDCMSTMFFRTKTEGVFCRYSASLLTGQGHSIFDRYHVTPTEVRTDPEKMTWLIEQEQNRQAESRGARANTKHRIVETTSGLGIRSDDARHVVNYLSHSLDLEKIVAEHMAEDPYHYDQMDHIKLAAKYAALLTTHLEALVRPNNSMSADAAY